MTEKSFEIENIVIKGEKPDRNVTSFDMGSVKLQSNPVEIILVNFGERDILKINQLTPGVKSAGEGNTGFNVRVGGIDQNIILIDKVLVYKVSQQIKNRNAIEWVSYIQNSQILLQKLSVNYGLRLALFSNIGPRDFYKFDNTGNLEKTITFDSFEFVKTQGGLISRLAINFMINSSSSVKTK